MTIDISNSLKIQETTMRVYLYSIRHDIFTYSHRFLLSIFLLNDDIIFKLHFILLAILVVQYHISEESCPEVNLLLNRNYLEK